MSFTTAPLPKMSRNASKPEPATKSPQVEAPSEKFETNRREKPSESDNKSDHSNPKQHPKGNILHISNIDPKLTYEQIRKRLYDLFSIHGPIYEIVIKTKETGQHFAFVDYPDINDTEKAWKAARNEGKWIDNRKLLVNYCEDPKKNADRKDQKCFLCHGTGHKAVRCPVKPEMIKPKPKKIEQKYADEDQTNVIEPLIPKSRSKPHQSDNEEYQRSESQSSEQQPRERDPDYLRFLKLKKKLLEKKLRKKVRKSKKKRN